MRLIRGLLVRVIRVLDDAGVGVPRRARRARLPAADADDLQVALRVGGGRLRLAEARGEARREDEALVRHLEDLVAGLRVPEQAPLELEEDDVERRQELGVRQLRER